VREAVYRGGHADIFLEPGPLRVRAPFGSGLQVGSEVWLELPPEHIEVLID
jgi:spermidine/putrescine transport system ATP-binding protein